MSQNDTEFARISMIPARLMSFCESHAGARGAERYGEELRPATRHDAAPVRWRA